MIRRPPRSTQSRSSAASDVYKRQSRYRLPSSLPLPRHCRQPGSRRLARPLAPLVYRGDALPAAYAHRDERVPATGPAQLIQRLYGEDGASGTERMPKRYTAAVRIGPVLRQAELADDGKGLGGERLVDLEEVDVVKLEPCSLQD